MESIKKIVWIAIIFTVAGPIFTFFRDIYLANTYGALEIPFDVKRQWELISLLVVGLQNVASALWLWYEGARNKSGRVVWSLFGLVVGLIGVVIFYLVRLNFDKKI